MIRPDHTVAGAAAPFPTPRGTGGAGRRWLWIVVWWTAFGSMSAVQYVQMAGAEQIPVSWATAVRAPIASAWLWIPATWLALLVTRFAPLGTVRWQRAVPPHLLATGAVVLYRAVAVVTFNDAFHWYRTLPAFTDVLVTSTLNNVFFYWLITAAAHALFYEENSRLRESQLAEARLHALTAQLQPHFLFNALNTVAALVHEDPATAERVVVKLSALMRRTIDASTHELVPLRDELQLLANYLDVEQARFEGRLAVRWNVDPSAGEAMVPHFILQPLVENAIVHGFRPIPGDVVIGIAARRENGRIGIDITDSGAGFDTRDCREGVGLGNTRARLDAVYRGDFVLDIESARGRGTAVRLQVPFRAGHVHAGVS